jgi:hypothetical protein
MMTEAFLQMDPFVNQDLGLLIWTFFSISFHLVFKSSSVKLEQFFLSLLHVYFYIYFYFFFPLFLVKIGRNKYHYQKLSPQPTY